VVALLVTVGEGSTVAQRMTSRTLVCDFPPIFSAMMLMPIPAAAPNTPDNTSPTMGETPYVSPAATARAGLFVSVNSLAASTTPPVGCSSPPNEIP
jgi:hypothetical protein